MTDPTTQDRPARGPLLLMTAALLAQACYVRDIPFISDEPAFLAIALVSNQGGHLATAGLPGSFGVTYSPVPVWIYQLLLHVTLDAAHLAAIKILLVSAALALSLWRLCRSTRLSPWPLLLAPVSPFLAFYQRLLWDNVYLIPITAGMLAVTASFMVRPRAWLLAVLTVLSALAFNIHPIAIVPIAAAVFGVLLFGWPWMVEHRITVAGCGIAGLAAASPLVYAIVFERGNAAHPHPAQVEWLAPLKGFFYWSHHGFEPFMESFYRDSAVLGGLRTGSGWLVVAVGASAIAMLARQSVRRAAPLDAWPVRDRIAVISAGIVIGQLALLFGLRLDPQWHYFNATCIGYFYLVWWAFDRARERGWARAALAVHVLATAVMTLLLAIHIHRHHGDRSWRYGATLGNQMDVARQIVERGGAGVRTNVANYEKFPQALEFLVYARAAATHTKLGDGRETAMVRYSDADGDDGKIEVVFSP